MPEPTIPLPIPPAGRWIRATSLGWALGIVLIIALVLLLSGVGGGDLQVPLGLGMGLGVGFVQGRLLSTEPTRRRRWIAATAAGLTLPFLLLDTGQALGLPVPFVLGAYIAVGGVLAAVLQVRSLGGAAKGGPWVAASLLGWALAGGTVALNDMVLARVIPNLRGVGGALLYLALMFLGGPLLGAAQALVLGRRRATA